MMVAEPWSSVYTMLGGHGFTDRHVGPLGVRGPRLETSALKRPVLLPIRPQATHHSHPNCPAVTTTSHLQQLLS